MGIKTLILAFKTLLDVLAQRRAITQSEKQDILDVLEEADSKV